MFISQGNHIKSVKRRRVTGQGLGKRGSLA